MVFGLLGSSIYLHSAQWESSHNFPSLFCLSLCCLLSIPPKTGHGRRAFTSPYLNTFWIVQMLHLSLPTHLPHIYSFMLLYFSSILSLLFAPLTSHLYAFYIYKFFSSWVFHITTPSQSLYSSLCTHRCSCNINHACFFCYFLSHYISSHTILW